MNDDGRIPLRARTPQGRLEFLVAKRPELVADGWNVYQLAFIDQKIADAHAEVAGLATLACTCCVRIFDGRFPAPAVASWWRKFNGLIAHLCQDCLNTWFDNADDDDDLEPDAVFWLDGSRRLVGSDREGARR